MKFFLCDDDSKMQEHYAEKIQNLCIKHNIRYEFFIYTSGEQMLFDFEDQDAFSGVIFLDINMPETDGITLAKKLREMGCQSEIIFLTVSKKHFLLAFDVNAFNYILKDETSDKRFEDVFLRAMNTVLDKEQEYFLFTSGIEKRSIALKSIRYFQVIKRLITVYYDNEEFEFYSTISRLEVQLAGGGFVRVHRSFLVALTYIQSMSFKELTLRDGTVIPIGRSYYPDIKEAFNTYSKIISK